MCITQLLAFNLRSQELSIPQQIAPEWCFLHAEVVRLHCQWHLYNELYGTSCDRIQLLNKTAPTFFAMLQRILLDDVQLALAKLADRDETAGHPNLTLDTLQRKISKLPDLEELADSLKMLLSRYRTASETIILRRNKDIAHIDFQEHIDVTTIPAPSRREIENALAALREFMQAASRRFNSTHMAYELASPFEGSGRLLLAAKQSVRYCELVETGAIGSTDIAATPWFSA